MFLIYQIVYLLQMHGGINGFHTRKLLLRESIDMLLKERYIVTASYFTYIFKNRLEKRTDKTNILKLKVVSSIICFGLYR